MNWQLKKTVALVGMMGAGKTAVGTQLARRLAVPFHDSDDEIVKAASMSIAEIFARDGEEFFRARESEVLARLLAGTPAILSTGGGTFLRAENRAAIDRAGVALWLRADPDLLWQRVRHKNTRPLLQTPDPRGTLIRLLAEREPFYAQAVIVVDSEAGLSIDSMVDRVIAALENHPGVLERLMA